jgi:uncharacterized protein
VPSADGGRRRGVNSCLYECTVMHHRVSPKVHHFEHRLFMFYFDLDELEMLSKKTPLFSHNRKNLYAFRDDDHEPAGAGPLRNRLITFLKTQDITLEADTRIMLLTLPRVAGYVFNPISVYFCFNRAGEKICAVAEVGNTYREMKLYVLNQDTLANGAFSQSLAKLFYISPFSNLDLKLEFQLYPPTEKLQIRVDEYDGEKNIFASTLTGRRAELTGGALFWFTLKYPLITLKVIFLIHWQALRLWLKRVPYHAKAANVSLQREVLRPHVTLTQIK